MENVWVLAAEWVGLALVATLVAIWFRISTALTDGRYHNRRLRCCHGCQSAKELKTGSTCRGERIAKYNRLLAETGHFSSIRTPRLPPGRAGSRWPLPMNPTRSSQSVA